MQSSLIPQGGHFFCFLFPDCSCNFLHTSAKDFQLACSDRKKGEVDGRERDKHLQVHASPISSTNRPKHTSSNFYGALMIIELQYIERER